MQEPKICMYKLETFARTHTCMSATFRNSGSEHQGNIKDKYPLFSLFDAKA